jgi:hypothetical protein
VARPYKLTVGLLPKEIYLSLQIAICREPFLVDGVVSQVPDVWAVRREKILDR